MIKYKRIAMNFSPLAYECLEDVAMMLDSSKADALRRSLGFIKYILKERIKGNVFIIENKNGNYYREVLTF